MEGVWSTFYTCPGTINIMMNNNMRQNIELHIKCLSTEGTIFPFTHMVMQANLANFDINSL